MPLINARTFASRDVFGAPIIPRLDVRNRVRTPGGSAYPTNVDVCRVFPRYLNQRTNPTFLDRQRRRVC